MRLQILLNEKNPRHKVVIDYLAIQGKQSGVPKELLLAGFESLQIHNLQATAPVKVNQKSVIENIKPRININSIVSG